MGLKNLTSACWRYLFEMIGSTAHMERGIRPKASISHLKNRRKGQQQAALHPTKFLQTKKQATIQKNS